jgi:hypothetical protein
LGFKGGVVLISRLALIYPPPSPCQNKGFPHVKKITFKNFFGNFAFGKHDPFSVLDPKTKKIIFFKKALEF